MLLHRNNWQRQTGDGLKPKLPQPAAALQVAAWFIFLSGGMPLAHAQESTRPFKLILNAAEAWDSNVFRVPSGAPDPQAAQGNGGKSDRFTALTYGVRFDKSYAQQRFVADVTETRTRYDKFTSQNNDAQNASARWDWHLSPRISGVLSASHSESVVAQEDIVLGRRLIKTTSDRQRFSVDGWLSGGWHLLTGVSHSKSENSQVFAAVPGTRETGQEVGVRYDAASGSSITAMQRWTDGEYPGQSGDLGDFINNKFSVREAELSATWIASMRSTLNGRAAWTERRYKGPSALDFSGLSGELRYVWTPSGRLSVNASAARNLTPFFQLGSSSRADTTFSIGPTWTLSDKVTLSLGANHIVNDYRGRVRDLPGPLRRDTTNSARLSVSWIAHQTLTLGASVDRSRRRSNYDAFEYDDAIARLTAAVVF
jgi:exopolysaccharide biosynthesis operon protein EpsL